jgi:serine/threonine protein kinase
MSAGLPRAFGRYALLASLGRGGMGEVFLARHGALEGAERLCVVKTLRGDLTSNTEYLGRFLDEARIVVQLSHAGICHVFDAGRVDDDVYIAMEFIPGVNLRMLLSAMQENGATLTTSLALHIASEVLDALAYAHRLRHRTTGVQLNVVHRDVSPHNVMVSFEGEVKLIDFGLAESNIKEEHTATQQVLGKVAYMSPEQARGDSVDAATDQFASAIMLYEMLAQDRFYGEMTTHQIWQIVGHGGFRPRHLDRVPAPVVPILLRALAPTIDERYANCDDLRDAIDDVRATHFPGSGKRDLRQLLRTTFAAKVIDVERLIARASTLKVRVPDDESGSQTGVDPASFPVAIDLPLGVDSSPERRATTQPSKSRAPTASEARAIDLAPAVLIGPPPPSTDAHEPPLLFTETDLRPGSESDFQVPPETDSQSGVFVSSETAAPTRSSSSAPLGAPTAEVSRIERAWQNTSTPSDDTSRVMRAAASDAPMRKMAKAAVVLIVCLVAVVVLLHESEPSGAGVVVHAPDESPPPPTPNGPPAVVVDAQPTLLALGDVASLDASDIDDAKGDAPQTTSTSARTRRDKKPSPQSEKRPPPDTTPVEPKPTTPTPVVSAAPEKPIADDVKPAAKPAPTTAPPTQSEPTVAEMLAILRDCTLESTRVARGLLLGKSASSLSANEVEVARIAAKKCAPKRFTGP